MNYVESKSQRALRGLLVSAVLGAAAMYVFDPDKGRRRRALARDKMRKLVADSGDLLSAAARDARFRARGLKAHTLRLFKRKDTPGDDLVLIERVRARMGRVVSHPHAVQIGARTGRVTLSGPILESEVDALLCAARSVPGVSQIDDHLVTHQRPGSVPGLQGGARRPEMRSETRKENWTPALRVAAIVGGGLLALYGTRRRTLTGFAVVGMGLGMTARGVSNLPIRRMTLSARDRMKTEKPRYIQHDMAFPRVQQERPALH